VTRQLADAAVARTAPVRGGGIKAWALNPREDHLAAKCADVHTLHNPDEVRRFLAAHN
jgi:hypothetical protein